MSITDNEIDERGVHYVYKQAVSKELTNKQLTDKVINLEERLNAFADLFIPVSNTKTNE